MKNEHIFSNDVKTSFTWEYLYVFVLLIKYAFYNTKINIPDFIQTLLTVALITIYIIALLKKRESLETLIIHVIALTVGLISYYVTGMSLFLLIILLYLIINKNHINNYIKLFLVVRISSLLIVVLCSLAGIISNSAYSVYKSGAIIALKAYGFNHPNQLAQALASVCMALLCISYKRKKPIYFTVLILTILNYIVTKSRSALLCTLILLVLSIFTVRSKLNEIGKKRINSIYSCVYMIFFISGIGFPILMTKSAGKLKEIIYAINGLLGSRFSFASAVLNNYHITLFGNTFDFSYLEHIYGDYAVDNSYINILFNFGVLALVFYALTSFFSMRTLIKNDRMVLANYILVVLLWGNFENVLFNVSINMTLILIATVNDFKIRHLKIKI